MGRPKYSARGREAGTRFPVLFFRGAGGAREAVGATREIRGFRMQENTAAENARRRPSTRYPLVLAVLVEARIERSAVENARRRQRTLYPLFSPKARIRIDLSGRLSRTLDGDRERSTPFSRRRLGKRTA